MNRIRNFRKLSKLEWTQLAFYLTEKKVVSGGSEDEDNLDLSTVEFNDVIDETWSSMPDMIESRSLHNLVFASNELFVIGDEVDFIEDIDSLWNKFVAIKSN